VSKESLNMSNCIKLHRKRKITE